MTPPYYSDDMVTLYLGDTLDTMHTLANQSIDALITDPPYCSGGVSESARTSAAGQGLRSENIKKFGWFTGDNMGTAGLTFLLRSMAFESVRVVKSTGSAVCFCDWRMLPTLAPAIESAGLRYQAMLVWDKASMGLGTGFRNQHELAMHFTYGDPEYFDRSTSNILRVSRVSASEREHQTQKPYGLMTKIIRVVCPPAGLVLDPFAGSGTTLVACKSLGIKSIGIERDEQHLETCANRLAQSSLSL